MTNPLMRHALAACIIAAAVGMAAQPLRAEETIVDGGGRTVRIVDTSRILSIGGDVTEILYALGAADKIIAVDSTSQHPAEALSKKANVGYMRALAAEGVLSTNPTLIIAAKDAGPPPVVAVLKSSSIPYVEVPRQQDAGRRCRQDPLHRLRGRRRGRRRCSRQDVERDFALLAEQRAKITNPKRALFVLSVQNGRATVAGTGTSADAMLRLAGAVNAASDAQGYKPLADEAGVELAPDAIVTMQHGKSGPPSDAVATIKALADSPAMKQHQIIEMNGLYLLGFGPRCARAARDLMSALYPELAQKRASAGE